MGFDLDYESNKTSSFNSLFQFSKKNLDKILIPFLLTIPNIGKSVYAIAQDVIKLKEEYFEFHNETNESDNQKASNFIKSLYKVEGSIYEDNFYTQLIRQLLEVLKLKTSKQSVLIIDDLDRMDPEHIFRILNIFSVHFDSFNEGEIEIHNKFGFDKIILVCDYENIRKIYEHKYGKGVDFGGYSNKYYSKNVYHFNYKDEVNHILKNIDNIQLIDNDIYSAFFNLTDAMFRSGLLSLRDIYKIKSIGLNTVHKKLLNTNTNHNNLFCFGLYSPTITILFDTLGYSVFKNKIENLKTIPVLKNIISLQYSCLQLMGYLHEQSHSIKHHNLEENTHSFHVGEYRGMLEIKTNDYKITNIHTNETQKLDDFKWKNSNLKTLLLENIEMYQFIKSVK